jgi:hypothetical protein
MEVHHHSHTPPSTGSGHRKKWTHYFWEFLMLFLAVFCGFLAEYQLEHTIEHQRAKVYATNLFEDMKKDTAELRRVMRISEANSKKLDTLCLLITKHGIRKIPPRNLLRQADFTTSVQFFSSNNATIEELKGSGGLRLLKPSVSKQISLYDKRLRDLANEYALSRAEFSKMEELYFKVFDRNLFDLLNNGLLHLNADSLLVKNPAVINDDPVLIKEYLGWVSFEKFIYREQIRDHLQPLALEAAKILALLEKEYHLD